MVVLALVGLAAVLAIGAGQEGMRALAAAGGRGDCNNDAKVDAGDISAVILEVFDNDGNLAVDVGGGSFPGDPEGCDANADTIVDAGDLSRTIIVIFSPPTSTPTATPTATATATATATPSETPYVPPDTIAGVQADDQQIVTPVLNHLAEAGLRFVRMRVMWRYIEPVETTPPTYGWTSWDNWFGSVAGAGFEPIGVVFNHPPWAATTSCGPIDKVPLSRYGDFIRALVERYDGDGVDDAPGSPRVRYWEIGNEEDFDVSHASGEGDYGSCFGGQAAAYGAYLRTAYLAAKEADSTSVVLFGGLAYERFYNKTGYSPTGPFDYTFASSTLDWLYTNHGTEAAWPFFDWMVVHVYNDYRNNWDGTLPNDQELMGKVKHFRDHQMVHSGWYDLRSEPMASTEVSLPSEPTDSYTNRSEAIQAAYPGQALVRSMAAGLTSVTWYTVEDYTGGRCFELYDWLLFGLLRSMPVYYAATACGSYNPIPDYSVSVDHEPKPAHTAYGVAVDQLAGATYDRQLTTAETGSSNIEAFRFTRGDDLAMIAAFTDNGERLGRKGYSALERDMTFDASVLPGWTGRIAIVDHLGNTTHETGTSITLTITQWPVYVRPD
jgi:hypothetical protein